MALQIRFFTRKLSNLIKADTLWRRAVKYDPVNMYKYKIALKELKINEDENFNDYIYFQSRTFRTCPTDILQSLISESFAVIKEKKLVHNIDLYNIILKNYVTNNINFDVDNLLQEMRKKKLEFNKETFSLLIQYYCNIGDMNKVEILLREMTSRNDEVDLSSQIEIIKGYIIAGHPETSQKYITENHFEENDPEIVKALLLGYSSVGQIDIVMEMIDKMKQDNMILLANDYFQFYVRLAQSNIPDSNLEKILLAMPDPQSDEIIDIILDLNRVKLFDHSLRLIEKYKDNTELNFVKSDLMLAFNTKNCPIEIYKQALTILLQFKCKNISSNLFAYMDYNDATIFANNLINEINGRHIAASLLNKAINEQEIDKIEISLQFAKDKLDLRYFNMLLIFTYIPSMLENGLVSNCQELINLFPAFEINVIRASFIYCLINKDFDQFSDLRTIYKLKNQFYPIKYNSIAKEMLYNYKSTKELNRLAILMNVSFNKVFVTQLFSELITNKIIYLLEVEDIDEIYETIKLAENFNILFDLDQLNKLIKKANQYEPILKSLFDRIAPTKYEPREF